MTRLSQEDIGTFLEGLRKRKSRGELADASQTIKNHETEIEIFLHEKEITDQFESAEYYRQVINAYRDAPKGVAFVESTYSLRHFKPINNKSHSLTFPTDHKTAKIVGWILVGLIAAGTLYLGYELSKNAKYLFEQRAENIESAITEKR